MGAGDPIIDDKVGDRIILREDPGTTRTLNGVVTPTLSFGSEVTGTSEVGAVVVAIKEANHAAHNSWDGGAAYFEYTSMPGSQCAGAAVTAHAISGEGKGENERDDAIGVHARVTAGAADTKNFAMWIYANSSNVAVQSLHGMEINVVSPFVNPKSVTGNVTDPTVTPWTSGIQIGVGEAFLSSDDQGHVDIGVGLLSLTGANFFYSGFVARRDCIVPGSTNEAVWLQGAASSGAVGIRLTGVHYSGIDIASATCTSNRAIMLASSNRIYWNSAEYIYGNGSGVLYLIADAQINGTLTTGEGINAVTGTITASAGNLACSGRLTIGATQPIYADNQHLIGEGSTGSVYMGNGATYISIGSSGASNPVRLQLSGSLRTITRVLVSSLTGPEYVLQSS